jgi:F-type H+-transporting ATPase subunit epsilon
MAISVHLDVVSAEKQIFSGLAEMVVLTGELGELGILPNHTQLLTTIKPGPVRVIKQGGKEEIFYVSGGILEVQPNSITILADTVVRAADLDEAKTIEAKERAERLIAAKQSHKDFSQALIDLSVAIAQLRAIRTLKQK